MFPKSFNYLFEHIGLAVRLKSLRPELNLFK